MIRGPQPELKQLHLALLDAFPTYSSLLRMVRFGLGINARAVVGDSGLEEGIYNLIEWAETRNRIPDLIEAALGENPDNPRLQRVAAHWRLPPEETEDDILLPRPDPAPIEIPVVVVAMNRTQAEDLLTGAVFQNEEWAYFGRTHFGPLRDILVRDQQIELAELMQHYGADPDDWMPYGPGPRAAIREIVIDIVQQVNQAGSTPTPHLPITAPLLTTQFFRGDGTSWNRLREKRPIVLVDALSLYHPHIRQILKRSGIGAAEHIGLLVFAPSQPSAFRANQLIAAELDSELTGAYARYKEDLDQFYECGVSDLHVLRRWLRAIFPASAESLRTTVLNAQRVAALTAQVGDRSGVQALIFGSPRGGA